MGILAIPKLKFYNPVMANTEVQIAPHIIEAWRAANDQNKTDLIARIEEKYGPTVHQEFLTALEKLKKLASLKGQKAIISAGFGAPEYDKRSGTIPRHVKIWTTSPVSEAEFEMFSTAEPAFSQTTRTGYLRSEDYSRVLEKRFMSRGAILVQVSKITIGIVSEQSELRVSGVAGEAERSLELFAQKRKQQGPGVIVGQVGYFRNRPLSS